ncbi:hypothetical protein RAA17_22160 [Komagataeibacter rhaeticus]|nr:hypothetical protein [Komagataeibacter rhaeticus]
MLNTDLLKRFYDLHDFEPVWDSHPAQAKAVLKAIAQAGDQGLDPASFHADLLRHDKNLTPLERELLLSDAALSYADALAHGAVPPERRADNQALAPAAVDVAAVVSQALDAADPAAMIESLAPRPRAIAPCNRHCGPAVPQDRPSGARSWIASTGSRSISSARDGCHARCPPIASWSTWRMNGWWPIAMTGRYWPPG